MPSDLTDPIDVMLLLLWRQLELLFYWAWKVGIREQVFEAGVNLIERLPLKTLLFWVGALGDVDRNRLATLGRSLGRRSIPLD